MRKQLVFGEADANEHGELCQSEIRNSSSAWHRKCPKLNKTCIVHDLLATPLAWDISMLGCSRMRAALEKFSAESM